jgi:molybdate transport system substrate-binding protein
MRTIRTLSVTVGMSVALVLVGCSSDDSSSTTTTAKATTTAPRVTGAVTVSAAASLTEAFTTIKDDFTKANPDATVTINFGSSGQLATQIQGGAPADVAAFADEAPMKTLSDASLLAGTAKVFARNQLVIVTKPGNPKKVSSLADLATVGTVSLCAETAPCGKFAGQALQKAGVTVPTTSITRGPDVKATLAAVTEGDAEAAIVYVTDAKAAGAKVASVAIPDADNVVANYPIAVVKASTDQTAATAFEDYVLGSEGRAVLEGAGFLAP